MTPPGSCRRYFEPRNAAKKLMETINWRARFQAETKGVRSASERRTNKGYLHSHLDVLGRPVIVAKASRHSIFFRRLVESKLLCVEVSH